MESDEILKNFLLVFHPVINTKLNAMKLLKILIKPILLEEICKELRHHGVIGMLVFRGEGTGRYIDPTKEHGSLDFPAPHAELVKIEIVTHDDDAIRIADIIQKKATTGTEGDGIIFISPIEEAVRIKDGTRGTEILF
ncbi:MAG: transcriptional regulator [Balneola sp.]|nr:transcriptional regulator [Balneola sp.]|tara:strand:- start:3894 stop:4307 length:414 start_codon:yes stop_codon:yes gene_type:complete